MMLPRITSRSGLTLLEVVFAMAIFLFAMLAIWQLLTFATDRAREVKLQAYTSLRCQGKLNEAMAGAEPLSSTDYTPYEDEASKALQLQWKMDATEMMTGVYEVRVSVKAVYAGERFVESSLSQIILDPAKRGSTNDPPIMPDTPPATPATPSTPESTTPPTTTPPATTPPATTPNTTPPATNPAPNNNNNAAPKVIAPPPTNGGGNTAPKGKG